MTRITIVISLRDGKLYYQDSESHSGFKIETHVQPQDEIEWIAEPGSGIEELKDPVITGTPGFFEKEPSRVGPTQWNARAGNINEGNITYNFSFKSNGAKISVLKSAIPDTAKDNDPPGLLIP